MRVQSLPLDVWQNVVGHFEAQEAVRVFDALWRAGVFPSMRRLDAFWAVIMASRHVSVAEHEFDSLPDPEPFRTGVDQLTEMGVSRESAIRVLRDARGSWEGAMSLLGWH